MAQTPKNHHDVMDESILVILLDHLRSDKFEVTCGSTVTYSTVKAEGLLTTLRDGKAESRKFSLLADYNRQEGVYDGYYDRWEPVISITADEKLISWDEFESAIRRSYRSVEIRTWGPLY